MTSPSQPTSPSVDALMTEDQIKHMVDRFLGWKLPENFSPDAGISFKAAYNEHTAHPAKHEPSGTNLFDATQADAMVRYLVEGLPALSAPRVEPVAWRCFFCDEVFTDAKAASDHFGDTICADPLCKVAQIDGGSKQAAAIRAHKVMTAFEYISTPIIGWHEVCRNVDGFEGVGVRYLGEVALSAPRVEPVAELYAYIPDIVKNAMLTMWNYICDDSKHHPLDIEHGKGKFLTFEPRHWAQFTGDMVQRNIRDLFAAPPSQPDTGVREALNNALIEERQKRTAKVHINQMVDYLAGFDHATEAALAALPPDAGSRK